MLTDELLYKIWTSQSTYTDIPKTQLRYLASAIEAEVLQAQEPVAWRGVIQRLRQGVSAGSRSVSDMETEQAIAFPLLDAVEDALSTLYATPQSPAPCPYCDDTGDVHSLDGEWRGECSCGAALQSKVAEQSAEIGRLKLALASHIPKLEVRDAYQQVEDFSSGNYKGI